MTNPEVREDIPSSQVKHSRLFFLWQITRDNKKLTSTLGSLAFILLLTACGFEALHGKSYREKQAIDLSSILITVDKTRSGQLLEAEINDAINPTFEHREKLYHLIIQISQSEQRLFINPDGSSARSDIPVNSNYQLTRLADGKQLDSGSITRVSSYNTSPTADYSSYVSLQDAKKRAIRELAQSYKLRIANMLYKINNKDTSN